MIGELDRYLFREGTHWRLYDLLGAHPVDNGTHSGVRFAVWAPNARAVNLAGEFNRWDGGQNPMELDRATGIWHGFLEGISRGALYKYEIVDCHGGVSQKSDPVGFWAEVPPRSASIVVDVDAFAWTDQAWMQQRGFDRNAEKPWSIYEVHLGSWRTDSTRENGWRNYREIADELTEYCRQLGFTHVQLMPITEHPYTGSWGYQTVGYYSLTSRYGRPEDFMYFVNRCHESGIGVLLDWVPGHFPRDAHGLRRFDGTALYEHLDPRRGEHPDWGTMIFNYGRNEVANFLIAGALFWLDKYHVDGLRVDAVASMLYLDYSRGEGQWIPNEYGGRENLQAIDFLRRFNDQAHQLFPGTVTIAEESTAWPGVSRPTSTGGLGFDMKWNMGWMNDTLRYMRHDPIHRRFHHHEITFSIWYAFAESFVLPLSHDEVVHGKRSLIEQMPGDPWRKFANLRLLYAYMWTHPGKKLLFMGSEFAQWREWSFEHELSWPLLEHENHRGVQILVADLNHLYTNEPGLYELDFQSGGFQWLDYQDSRHSILAYLRRGRSGAEPLLVVCNFTPEVRGDYRIGLPRPGRYRIALNSDDSRYNGSGVAPNEQVESEEVPWHGFPQSALVKVPPLAVIVLKPG